MENAKEAVSRPGIMNELVELKSKYQVIHDILILLEKKSLNVSQTYSRVCEINIHDDKFGILAYIKRRLAGTDVNILMEGQMDWINPSDTILLMNAQSTSIDVERSFSKFKKMLEKDRNFKEEKIVNYIICYGNSEI